MRPPPSTSSLNLDHGQFVPGTVVAKRYRIVGLLGRGGMGEVYRADDLELGQAVALKFLPKRLVDDEAALSRFRSEVRLSRQVSHPNVCRVHDIGQADGQWFLSMEYVDGEDLSALLRRIGRFPNDRATEVARQLCLGLEAAHEKGVLHRDLKPANIMIDGRGKLLITDFGLAEFASAISGRDVRAGTPAYMAPEQLAGREVTARSDIYALGLVLHEVFTGSPIWQADTLRELFEKRHRTPSVTPSTDHVELEPAVRAVIERCLEADPKNRPSSAVAVAAELPGGDPLAAALAAGQTPSPEAVAAAGGDTAFSTRAAVTSLVLLVAAALSLFSVVFLRDRNAEHRLKEPQALAENARELIEELGWEVRSDNNAYGFRPSSAGLGDRAFNAGPEGIAFWYRESPAPLVPDIRRGPTGLSEARISQANPTPHERGMLSLLLDASDGRLLAFLAIPEELQEVTDASAVGETEDWQRRVEEALGVELDKLTPSEPLAPAPPLHVHRLAAWTSSVPGAPHRVEVGLHGDRLVYLRTFPSDDHARSGPKSWFYGRSPRATSPMVFFATFAICAIFAPSILRRRRADVHGAVRLAVYAFLLRSIMFGLQADHSSIGSVAGNIVANTLAWGSLVAIMFSLSYLVLEPLVRRFWPQMLIAWTRLLSGRWRDPLVGRDLLVGTITGIALTSAGGLSSWLQLDQPILSRWLDVLQGGRRVLYPLFESQWLGLYIGIVSCITLAGFRWLLRRKYFAVAANVLLMTYLWSPTFPSLEGIASAVVSNLLLIRFGLLSCCVSLVTVFALSSYPLTTHLNLWYSGSGLLAIAVFITLGVFGFTMVQRGSSPTRASAGRTP